MRKPSLHKRRLRDLLSIILLIAVAVTSAIFLNLSFLPTTLLFFGLPSAFLIWRKPSNLKKASAAALILGGIWGFAFDYVAEFNHAWAWSTNTHLTFPVQFFGVVSLDIMVWYVLWVFLVVAFYEYFAEYDFSKHLSKRAPKAALFGILAGALVVTVSKIAPSLITSYYTYLWLGLFTLVPFIYICLKRPSIFIKVLEIVPFFILLYLSFELTALYLHLWSFPGHYIGTVTIAGLTFPFEELFFWVLVSSAVAASYHEYCIDDFR